MSRAVPMYDPADPDLRESVELRQLAYSLDEDLYELSQRIEKFSSLWKVKISESGSKIQEVLTALDSATGILPKIAEDAELSTRRIPPFPPTAVERVLEGGTPPEPPGTYELVMLLNSVEGQHEPKELDSSAAEEALAWLIGNHHPSLKRLEELADWCRDHRPRPLTKTRTVLIEDLYEAAKQGHHEDLPAENRWRSYVAVVQKNEESDFSVDFPDFPGCVTADSTLDTAREMAQEALELHASGIFEDGDELPFPSRELPPGGDDIVALFFVELDLDRLRDGGKTSC